MSLRFAESRFDTEIDDDEDRHPDFDLVPIFAIVWLASVLRVVMALARDEVFGSEATLALSCAVALPVLLARPVIAWLAPKRSASTRPPRLRVVRGGSANDES